MMYEREVKMEVNGQKKKGKKAGIYFFFNDTATTEIYTLSLHDALPIYLGSTEELSARRGRGYRRC